MLTLECKIQICSKDTQKKVYFNYVNSIVVTTSCGNLSDTAVVKIPRKISWQGKSITDFINRDDSISIQMGYSEYGLKTVFEGYIKTIENGTPITITCENDMRLFKTINVESKQYKNFNIKDFIQTYAQGVEVEVPGELRFGTVNVQEMTLAQALDKLKGAFPWLRCFFYGHKFIVVSNVAARQDYNKITLSPDRNIISDDLKYSVKEDLKIAVVGKVITKDNKKIEVIVPDEAIETKTSGKTVTKKVRTSWSKHECLCPGATTEKEVRKQATDMLNELVQDKMTGSITTFGVPYIQKCDIVTLKDEYRKERNGKRFYVDGVVYTFSTTGYRQKITLGYELH